MTDEYIIRHKICIFQIGNWWLFTSNIYRSPTIVLSFSKLIWNCVQLKIKLNWKCQWQPDAFAVNVYISGYIWKCMALIHDCRVQYNHDQCKIVQFNCLALSLGTRHIHLFCQSAPLKSNLLNFNLHKIHDVDFHIDFHAFTGLVWYSPIQIWLLNFPR